MLLSCSSLLCSSRVRTVASTTGSHHYALPTMNKNLLLKENDLQTQQENPSFEKLYSQVGGHVSMKILNQRYVCKPLNLREASFYSKLPEELINFVPGYHGTVQLNTEPQINPRFVSLQSTYRIGAAGIIITKILNLNNQV